MTPDELARAVRQSGGRILSALTARYRDLDLAEEAFATACARALERSSQLEPRDSAAWLYRIADHSALDALRYRAVRASCPPYEPMPSKTPEEILIGDDVIIPDERLRLIFVCCHPALVPDARTALTLSLVCGLSTEEIARAFVVSTSTVAQRIVRAKRKIADAGIPFEVPGPDAWAERLDAVLATIEIAYAQAYADAACTGPHAVFAEETLRLARTLVVLLPEETAVLALAATVHYAEARRPARVDSEGQMIPLAEQDPARWSRSLIAEGETLLRRAARLPKPCVQELQAAIHATWCARASLDDAPPWADVLRLYDLLLLWRDDPVVRVNRAVAVAEVLGVQTALAEIACLDRALLDAHVPYHVVYADLLRRSGLAQEAARAYRRALELGAGDAERRWLERRLAGLGPLSRST